MVDQETPLVRAARSRSNARLTGHDDDHQLGFVAQPDAVSTILRQFTDRRFHGHRG